jgi:hypothetical protein
MNAQAASPRLYHSILTMQAHAEHAFTGSGPTIHETPIAEQPSF